MKDFTCLVLLAMLKESAFTDIVFRDMPSCPSAWGKAEFLRPRLVDAVREARKDERHATQVSQLARQGAGRFTGSCRVVTLLGICASGEAITGEHAGSSNAEPLGRVEKEPSQLQRVHIGASGSKNVYHLLVEDDGRFDEFCKDCAHAQRIWKEALAATEVLDVMAKIQKCVDMAKISVRFHGASVKKQMTYASSFLARKLFLLCTVKGQLQRNWHEQPLANFKGFFPDQKQFMDELPTHWSAGDASWFLARRPDRLPFCVMWCCLFNDVKHDREEVLDGLRSGSYMKAAEALRKDTGVEHHPVCVARRMLGIRPESQV